MHYILIRFTKGLDQDAFQELDQSGNLVRMTDLDGNTLVVPVVTEAHVVDANPPPPSWALPDPPPVPTPLVIPASVSKLQLYRAAKEIGAWDFIKSTIAAASVDIQDQWELTTIVEPSNPVVVGLAHSAGWTDEQLGQLFALAATK